MLELSFKCVNDGELKIDFDLIEKLDKTLEIPLVMHGGSGLSDDILKKLLSISNVKKINISTDVKLAYRTGILQAQKDGLLEKIGFQAINVEKYIHDAISDMVCKKMNLLDIYGGK